MSTELNLFEVAQRQLDEAANLLGLDDATHHLLRWPRRELRVTVPVRMDDGTVQVFHGYRVQYNDARGQNHRTQQSASGRSFPRSGFQG